MSKKYYKTPMTKDPITSNRPWITNHQNSPDFFKFAKKISMSSEAYVKSNTDNNICTIEFFHPAHNSLPSNILRELAEAVTVAGMMKM